MLHLHMNSQHQDAQRALQWLSRTFIYHSLELNSCRLTTVQTHKIQFAGHKVLHVTLKAVATSFRPLSIYGECHQPHQAQIYGGKPAGASWSLSLKVQMLAYN